MKAVLQRAALVVSLTWVVVLTLMFMVMLQTQAHNEQNGAFRGQYQGMAIEGLSVLQQELSKANIRISILEQEKGKAELSDPFPIRPKGTWGDKKAQVEPKVGPQFTLPKDGACGTCEEPKEEISTDLESRFTIEEVK